MKDHPSVPFDSLGKCLFCLTPVNPKTFTTEHIIPRSLCETGEYYVRQGSCRKCNGRANELYEAIALAHDFKTARYVLRLKRRSRGKKKKPLEPHWVAFGDHVTAPNLDAIEGVKLGPNEYPGLLVFPVFQAPGRLKGIDRQILEEMRIAIGNMGSGPATSFTIRESHNPYAFALTIAKIGYTFGAAAYGFDAFEHDDIRALLRGERADVFNFVGNALDIEVEPTPNLHWLALGEVGDWTVALVRLFARYNMPQYVVVLGRTRVNH